MFPEYNEKYVLTGIPIISENRELIIKNLLKKNIVCLKYTKHWYFFPHNRLEEFKNELNFYNKHFLIPISENINEYEMKKIVNTLNNIKF